MGHSFKKIAFHASFRPKAQEALKEITARYKHVDPEEADVIVVLGGDGTMLRALHTYHDLRVPFFGMNLGTLGFLLNDYSGDDLAERLNNSKSVEIRPLRMEALNHAGKVFREIAFNEVSLLRETHNAAYLKVRVDNYVRIPEMVCDGIMLSTPVGSTAYNLSAGGPIVPLNANVFPLTPISVFRPRRWPGALIDHTAEVTIDVLKSDERPVSVSADSKEVRDITSVKIRESRSLSCHLLFDPGNHLGERIFAEQFAD